MRPLGPDGRQTQGGQGKPRAEEEGPSFLHGGALGALGLAPQASGQGSGNPEKPKPQAATSRGGPRASLFLLPNETGSPGGRAGQRGCAQPVTRTTSSCLQRKGQKPGPDCVLHVRPATWPAVWGGGDWQPRGTRWGQPPLSLPPAAALGPGESSGPAGNTLASAGPQAQRPPHPAHSHAALRAGPPEH